MERAFGSIALVLVLSSMAGAQASPTTKSSQWTLRTLQEHLVRSGIRVRPDVTVEQPYLSVRGKVLVADDGTEIQAYLYKNPSARRSDTQKIDAKKAAPANMQPHWLMPVSFVTDANAALIVLSHDHAMHGRIAALFGADPSPQVEVEDVVRKFHQALQERDVKRIEALVADDIVVFENGGRNDGWADFRDNHLVPEMREPAPQTTWRLAKAKAGAEQGWAYTHETFKSARGTALVLWSVFVLEKRGAEWKIVALDWSIGRDQ